MDQGLIVAGVVLLAYALCMSIGYLWFERGGFVDPIVISWAGFAYFVALAMIMVGIYSPLRPTRELSTLAITYTFGGTLMFTLGLYAGKGKKFVKKIPTPAPSLQLHEILLIWSVCWAIGLTMFTSQLFLPPGIDRVAVAVTDGALGAAALLSVLGFFTARGNPIVQIFMLGSMAGIAVVYLNYYWSRRPLGGLLLAAFGYILKFRLARSSPITKLTVLGTTAIGLVLLLNFLAATRGVRFYGHKAGRSVGTLSAQATFDTFVAATAINYETFEFALQHFPSDRGYMWGAGYVPAFLFIIPRAIWVDKPLSTGRVVSEMWYGTSFLENNLGIVPFGETYANFGVLGIFLGLFVAGRVVRLSNTYLRSNDANRTLWIAWLMIMPDFATEWRGDFTSMTVQAVLRVSFFLGATWLIGRMMRRGGVAAPTYAPAATQALLSPAQGPAPPRGPLVTARTYQPPPGNWRNRARPPTNRP